ncbi:formimidoylglutamate deiminase [Lysobacter sp. A6]|uniref:Formimidoylglutamate deiminase n=1 Tax=Noviluteimonas lactosilytica TaxID=2888523 RepID=A0ABS8JF74_9GAMM|nr:formimidoylglutamate deiminase [Lysobacter lactosilyticus]MCC8362261.1 formimidoylglutamate deiminase [Lysobacter lactosilyticus]
METLHAERLWTPGGWRIDAGFTHDAGRIVECEGAQPSEGAAWVLPGIANLHSHAFQRAMAGLAERQTHPQDSFWTWRETMYRFAARFDPDTLHAVASQLYVEMLEAGYTTVCEFHYLHHSPDGRPYADRAAMSQALIAAARDTGIRMTLLPVLYMRGGFDGRALTERQQRFGHDVDQFLNLFDMLRGEEDDTLRVGIALHSLRAVPPDAMKTVLAELPPDTPVHTHIAEQLPEVVDCVALRGARPVEWLLANANVDRNWTLVHATHLDQAEVEGIARSGATVAICTTTEANLGDGLFPLRAFLEAGGSWGIGSDSHISVSPIEELRWLEYGQRLVTHHRNVSVGTATTSAGESLLHDALASAEASTGHAVGCFYNGAAADWLMLDRDAPQFIGATTEDAIDRLIFAGNRRAIREVHVAGNKLVHEGRHREREAIFARFKQAMHTLLA